MSLLQNLWAQFRRRNTNRWTLNSTSTIETKLTPKTPVTEMRCTELKIPKRLDSTGLYSVPINTRQETDEKTVLENPRRTILKKSWPITRFDWQLVSTWGKYQRLLVSGLFAELRQRGRVTDWVHGPCTSIASSQLNTFRAYSTGRGTLPQLPQALVAAFTHTAALGWRGNNYYQFDAMRGIKLIL